MMTEIEQNHPEQESEEFSLDDIMKEFASGKDDEVPKTSADEILGAAMSAAGVILEPDGKEEASNDPGDTVEFSRVVEPARHEDLKEPEESAEEVPADGTEEECPEHQAFDGEARKETEAVEPFSEGWEPVYDQPIADYVPPEPIVFRPRSRLRELKRKLMAGPEKRYYELMQLGLGKLQSAIFLSAMFSLISMGALLLHGLGMVAPERTRLMVFGQVLCMLLSGLLGSFQLLEGLGSLFHRRFTADTMLAVTFIACAADGLTGLWNQQVPYCGAFSLAVTMSLWGEYERRSTEMGQMDTLRRASRLDSLVKTPDFYDGRPGFLRAEGQVEDFMDHYREVSGPEKALSVYLIAAALLAAGIGVAGGILLDYRQGIRLWTAAMLAAFPVTGLIAVSRPGAILERRLHRVGAVLCGWSGVMGLCCPATVPVSDTDLFPVGSVKMNGVKFFGSRDPDQVVAYTTAVITADGTGLTGLFNQLLDSRNGRHYDTVNFQPYAGGLGGEVNGEPVLVGTQQFLQDMGVEVPEGTRVYQALYVAIDGELSGVFALTYGKVRSAAAGIGALCGYRSLTPVLTGGDIVVTESFLRSKFGVNTRRIAFPVYQARKDLTRRTPDPAAPTLALLTREELVGVAYAATGARSLRAAIRLGIGMHIIAGIVGLAVVGLLGFAGAVNLLTAENLLLFELMWMIPGFLITEWARNA